jgi:ElaB/YqjD/DUF883 family membrane-anchored ribosome-binding protein
MLHDNNPELIEREMARTRESIAEKVAALESKVGETIAAATGVVDNVKSTVHGAEATVKKAFDLPEHTRNHPWAMVGGAAALGLLAGLLATRRSAVQPVPLAAAQPREPDLVDELLATAGQELRTVANEFVRTLGQAARDRVASI